MKHILFFSLLTCFLISTAEAAIIRSRCEYNPTDFRRGSAPSAAPEFRAPTSLNPTFDQVSDFLRRFSSVVNLAHPGRPYDEAQIAHWRQFEQDMVVVAAASRMPDFEGATCVSTNQVIESVFHEFPEGTSEDQLRMGFQICQFGRQVVTRPGEAPRVREGKIVNTCRWIGRETGYTLDEIDRRFEQINASVQAVRYLNAAAWAVPAGWVSYRLFRFFRASGGILAGSISLSVARSTLIAAPTLAAVTMIRYTDLPERPIRRMIDLRNVARTQYDGRVEDTVYVDQPIEYFENVLRLYLETIR